MLAFLHGLVRQYLIQNAVTHALREGDSLPTTALDPSSFPTINDGRAYPVIFGTPRIDGYDTAWTGKPWSDAHHRSDVEVYRLFYCGAHLIVCQGPIDGFVQFCYGDAGGGKVCWPVADDPTEFAADGLTSATIAAPKLFGGPYRSGGITGTLDLLLGESDQARNDYLIARQGSADIPAYRFVASVVCKDVMWGNNPQPQVLAAFPKRVFTQGDGEERWYVEKAPINGGLDLNAVHILRECWTDTIWGVGRPESGLGDTWEAVADLCYEEQLGLTAAFQPEPGNLQNLMRQVEEIADLVTYKDPTTGKLEIMAIRDDYELDEVPHFNEQDFEVVNHTKTHWRYVPGRIVVAYSNRLNPDAGGTAPWDNDSVIAKQGERLVEQTLDYPLIHNDDLAIEVAARKGRALSASPHTFELVGKTCMRGLHVGSPLVLEYADPHLSITQMACRVMEISEGGSEDESVTLTVREDVYKAGYTIQGLPVTGWTEPEPEEVRTDIEVILAAEGCSATFASTAPV